MTSGRAIGWVLVLTQRGRDHHRQPVDQLAGQLPGDAAVAHDHGRPQDGHRHARRPEQGLDLAARRAGAADRSPSSSPRPPR